MGVGAGGADAGPSSAGGRTHHPPALLEGDLVLVRELLVRVDRMGLDQLTKIVREGGRERPKKAQNDEVNKSRVAGKKSRLPLLIAAKALDDEEVMVLVPLLRKMDSFHQPPPSPPAQTFVEVQHGDVRQIGHPGDGLQKIEPRYGVADEGHVEKDAEHQIRPL